MIKLMTARIMRHRQRTFWSTKKTGMAKNAKIERSVLQTLLAHFSCSRNKLTGTKLSPPDFIKPYKIYFLLNTTSKSYIDGAGGKVKEEMGKKTNE